MLWLREHEGGSLYGSANTPSKVASSSSRRETVAVEVQTVEATGS